MHQKKITNTDTQLLRIGASIDVFIKISQILGVVVTIGVALFNYYYLSPLDHRVSRLEYKVDEVAKQVDRIATRLDSYISSLR